MNYKLLVWVSGLLWLTASCTKEEKPKILLVGVFHDFPDNQQCNWKRTYDKLVKFNPDQISIEYDMPGDTVSLKNYLGDNYPHVWDSVMLSWVGKKINPADSVHHYQTMMQSNATPKNRLNLWKYYHLNADLGNRDFQTFLIQANWEKYVPMLDTTDIWIKAFYKRHAATIKRRKNGEFFNLVFPLAKELNIQYLLPTDYKGTYSEQSSAYMAFSDSLQGTPHWVKWESFWNEFNNDLNEQAASCRGLEYTNAEQWLLRSDSGQAKILDYLDNKDYQRYQKVWYHRNQEIAKRIVNAIQSSAAKKMAVFYGNMHIYPVRKFLEEAGFQVILLEELTEN